ncbi:hypothetical protein Aab01nite_22040 [Paractinoplanes abujensis]|uniref:2-phospho-L-lactate guanylyltransferase n=1 Tax=Paractinoplanes abujensis TaxID=882441 RepID=A0A7W7CYD5_9ACTN|nr:hypothetical protein [Actinoplanes abujensis]MBB4696916.1 hypothetical protein [Actinoplanes abujensis]GID18614.1 hypothetical protein Aab01nite_22040 [Actinoplanes abujensis]
MTRRLVAALLVPVTWSPPGVDLTAWRAALAEDVVDLLARLAQAEAAIAATSDDLALAQEIAWPGMRLYEVPTATYLPVLEAAAADGFDQAAVLAADAPDVPGMILGKLLRPLENKAVAVASGGPGNGLLGLATSLPAPPWLADHDLDTATAQLLRRDAPNPGDVSSTPEWRRLRGPAELAALDPALEGWENTRVLLGG